MSTYPGAVLFNRTPIVKDLLVRSQRWREEVKYIWIPASHAEDAHISSSQNIQNTGEEDARMHGLQIQPTDSKVK